MPVIRIFRFNFNRLYTTSHVTPNISAYQSVNISAYQSVNILVSAYQSVFMYLCVSGTSILWAGNSVTLIDLEI
jgi:hypothetical protein